MKTFAFDAADAADHAGAYQHNGYVHIRDGITREFQAFALGQLQRLLAAEAKLQRWEFRDKKSQYLFDFPEGSDWPIGVKAAVAAVAGLPADRLTVCERHIKAYHANAPETPPPHKDRVASQVAVGIALAIPEGSDVVLYPHHHREVNPFATTELLRRSLDDDALPEKLLAGVEPVRIDTRPGDVLMFRGSSIYHERHRPANSVVLYLKFNAYALDPLGEDPQTGPARTRSLSVLDACGERELLALRAAPSPRLEQVTRTYSRLAWKEILQARVWGEKEFNLSEEEFRLLRAAEGMVTIEELLERLGYAHVERAAPLAALRRLVRLQALDLLMPRPVEPRVHDAEPASRSAAQPDSQLTSQQASQADAVPA